ncbi:MAG: DNA-processing protein DprA [Anaerolineae bacterium]|nr:DNA-processing protein DprA [Anaerolineae bacterium]
MSETKYWLGFSLVQHIGSVRMLHLYKHFKSLAKAWHATENDLRDAGLAAQPLTALLQSRSHLDLDAEMQKVESVGAQLLTLADDAYPMNLRVIPDVPPVLYLKGDLFPTDKLALAIVGTRRATRYGRDAAHRMSHWLAKNDVTIVSGLAQGIDAAAHQGALDANGRTIAVLGCGIDRVYPNEHKQLAQNIIQSGALVSEFPIGMPPTGQNFPRRNRIISGLALGVMIAEAPERSGALITAEMALEQGRDVFAIPANIFNPMGTGGNKLIQEGAKLVMRARDILDELSIQYTVHESREKAQTIVPESDIEAVLLDLLESDPIHVDDIIRETGLATQDVTATLVILELKGLAQSVGHMQYCRAR